VDGGGGLLGGFFILFLFFTLIFIYLWGIMGRELFHLTFPLTCGGSSEMRGWSRSDIISGPAGGASGAKDGIGFGSDWIALSQDLLMTVL